jgi:hypothetical protein
VTRDTGGATISATARFDFGLSRFPAGSVISMARIHRGLPGAVGPIVVDSRISGTSAVANDA